MPDWQLVELGETTMRGQEDTGVARKVARTARAAVQNAVGKRGAAVSGSAG